MKRSAAKNVKAKAKTPAKKTAAPPRALKLTFRLRYHTNLGQSIFITGNHPLLGNGELEKALPLQYHDTEFWQITLDLPGAVPDAAITYNYFVREANGALTHDWGTDKTVNPASLNREEALIIDSWNYAGYFENAFYTKPFRNVLLRGQHAAVKPTVPDNPTHLFRVKAPLLTKSQTVCLVGNHETLHNWNTAAPVLLAKDADDDYFSVRLDLSRATFPLEYKYGIYDVARHQFVRFEIVDKRTLQDSIATSKLTLLNDGFMALPANTWKGAGVAIPIFSLRSEAGFGVGEFTDLKLLVDWCRKVGLKLIQLLPINDSTATHTWVDSYPYAAISAFALHPQYLNLETLAGKSGKAALKKLEKERKRLNALEAVDYEAVMKSKTAFIKKMFATQKARTFASAEYKEFFARNRAWLEPYAAFGCLRDKFGTPDFSQWPGFAKYNARQTANLAAKTAAVRSALDLHYFTQFHLHC
jgi:4-alpha-glucanotransferase